MWPIRWVLKPLVFAACLLPALHLALGALNAAGVLHFGGVSLGADPVKVMLHTCGRWTLNFLMITLCMTPLRALTRYPTPASYTRRTLPKRNPVLISVCALSSNKQPVLSGYQGLPEFSVLIADAV